MDKTFYIIMGRSGSGKGTQADLLMEHLKDRNIKLLTTGRSLRSFAGGPSYTASKIKSTIDMGGLCPEFLAVWNWAHLLISNVEENNDIVLDGAPRRLHEAQLLENAADYYGYKNINVIYIDVSEEWAREKLTGRGREDDIKSGIERRLDWFDSEVLPIVEYYKSNSKYNLLTINGMQGIEDVQKEILEKLK